MSYKKKHKNSFFYNLLEDTTTWIEKGWVSSSTVMQEVLGKSYDTLGDYNEVAYG